MSEPVTPTADAVGDAEWAKVRHLAERVALLEAAMVEGHDDDELEGRLARARIKAARATERALLADSLADELGRLRLKS